jgi:Domain of unknown function (DUF4214)
MRQGIVSRLALAAVHVMVLGGMAGARPAESAPAMFAGEAAGGDSRTDRMIERAFRDALGRAPHDDEYRRYRRRVEEDGWDERDIKDDVNARDDYRSHKGSSERRYDTSDVDRIVRRAYEDILDRAPDSAGMRLYRSRMIDDGWSEHQVRDALRNSPEAKTVASRSADRVITRAYQDVLGREPDYAGLNTYRRKMLDEGWDEHDVRKALQRSPEMRQKQNSVNDAEAQNIVRRAYQNVLGREPDPAGMAGYKSRVTRDRWTQSDVERELRRSDEYRSKR